MNERKAFPFSGYCPTQEKEVTINIYFTNTENEYCQTGADCEYASFGDCSIYLECPIRKSVPEHVPKKA